MVSSNSFNQLELTASQAHAVREALQYWSQSGLISTNLIGNLFDTIQVVNERHDYDWDRLPGYAMTMVVPLLAIATFGHFHDSFWKDAPIRILSLPAALRVSIICLLAPALARQLASVIPEATHLIEVALCISVLLLYLISEHTGLYRDLDDPDTTQIADEAILRLLAAIGAIGMVVYFEWYLIHLNIK
ncbi:hypothetical protein GGR51DRAFT_575549 [Nemania sp. FL0031]|nr:hypothetical protein GGR51DRAFT_575549 [Nemania sp. FL0031]